MLTSKFTEYYNGLNHNNKNGSLGIIEFIFKDRNGKVIDHIIEKNIIKIFAKEMLAHRIASTKVWDPNVNGGLGAWVSSGIDVNEEFSARYVLFGASFDAEGNALGTNDPRFYTIDPATGQFIPIQLNPSADYDGGLINAIPISDPTNPLKRIENIEFQSTYQPSGSPLLDANVRAINNIVTLETTLQTDEYNGFGLSSGDFFTITEVALAGGRLFNSEPNCNCNPLNMFLQGLPVGSGGSISDASAGSTTEVAINVIANGTNVVTISPSDLAAVVGLFSAGDQVKLVNKGATQLDYNTLNQKNSNFLITSYSGGGDIQLDRVPTDSSGNPLIGEIGIFRNTLKIFSHRILSSPIRKSDIFQIVVRWNLIFN